MAVRSRPTLLIVVGLIALSATSCTDDPSAMPPSSPTVTAPAVVPDEQPDDTPPATAGGPIEVGPLGSTDIDIDTGSGEVQLGDAERPAMLPDTFPVPDDLTIQLSTETADAAGFSGVTALEFAALVDFYLDAFAEGGWTAQRREFVEDTIAVLTFSGDAGSGEVAIAQAPGGGRSVLVTFRP